MNKCILRNIVGNKIFSAKFHKADGTLRTMVCRAGVRTVDHKDRYEASKAYLKSYCTGNLRDLIGI